MGVTEDGGSLREPHDMDSDNKVSAIVASEMEACYGNLENQFEHSFASASPATPHGLQAMALQQLIAMTQQVLMAQQLVTRAQQAVISAVTVTGAAPGSLASGKELEGHSALGGGLESAAKLEELEAWTQQLILEAQNARIDEFAAMKVVNEALARQQTATQVTVAHSVFKAAAPMDINAEIAAFQ